MPRFLAVPLLLLPLAAHAQGTAPTVEHGWARATIAAVKTGAAYVTITGHGTPDRLMSVTTSVAGRAELHETIRDGDVMRMRPVEGIAVPAAATVTLGPGGIHIMLLDLKQPLTPGQHFPLTLRFEKAGTLETDVVVQAAGAAMPMDMGGKPRAAPTEARS